MAYSILETRNNTHSIIGPFKTPEMAVDFIKKLAEDIKAEHHHDPRSYVPDAIISELEYDDFGPERYRLVLGVNDRFMHVNSTFTWEVKYLLNPKKL